MVDDALRRVEDELRGLEALVGGVIDCQKLLLGFLRSIPEVAGRDDAENWLLGDLAARLEKLRSSIDGHADAAGAPRGSGGDRAAFEELDVRRINVVEDDGTIRLVISNRSQAPDPTVDGQRFERTGGNAAGLIFYNDQGDECGGLVFGGKENPEGHEAEAALLFDRFRQDQVIGILHQETSDYRPTGLQVWDRPDIPLSAEARTRNSAASPDESERSAAADEVGRSDPLEVTRVFVGKSVDGAAVVVLHRRSGSTAASPDDRRHQHSAAPSPRRSWTGNTNVAGTTLMQSRWGSSTWPRLRSL